MPGLSNAWISGYTGTFLDGNISVLGELACVRHSGSIYRAYVWAIGMSGSSVCYRGPYKQFNDHHNTTTVPPDHFFGHILWDESASA